MTPDHEERSLLRRREALLERGREAEGRLLDALSDVAAAWLELSELEAEDRGLRRLAEQHRLSVEVRRRFHLIENPVDADNRAQSTFTPHHPSRGVVRCRAGGRRCGRGR